MGHGINDDGRTVIFTCDWCGLESGDETSFTEISYDDDGKVTVGDRFENGKLLPPDELICAEHYDVTLQWGLSDGDRVTYTVYPESVGMEDTPFEGHVAWNSDEMAYVIQSTGWSKRYFDDQLICDYVTVEQLHNIVSINDQIRLEMK